MGEAGDAAFRSFAERLRTGEDEATRELLARYSARLLALARARLGPRIAVKGDAEDALQSAFRTFFRRLGEDEIELRDWVSLSGLLSLLTLRKCQRQAARFSAARRDARREESLHGGGPEAFEVVVPDREPTPDEVAAFRDTVEWLLGGLDDRDRRVVEAVMAGESVAETAARVRTTRRTVQRTLVRARQRLLREAGRAEAADRAKAYPAGDVSPSRTDRH